MTSPDHVAWLDLLLGQAEQEAGLAVGQTGIEAQIEDARGLAAVNAIAAASPRLEALVFGPADFMASVGIRSLDVGGQRRGPRLRRQVGPAPEPDRRRQRGVRAVSG